MEHLGDAGAVQVPDSAGAAVHADCGERPGQCEESPAERPHHGCTPALLLSHPSLQWS